MWQPSLLHIFSFIYSLPTDLSAIEDISMGLSHSELEYLGQEGAVNIDLESPDNMVHLLQSTAEEDHLVPSLLTGNVPDAATQNSPSNPTPTVIENQNHYVLVQHVSTENSDAFADDDTEIDVTGVESDTGTVLTDASVVLNDFSYTAVANYRISSK